MTTRGALFLNYNTGHNDMTAKVETPNHKHNRVVHWTGQNCGKEDYKILSLMKRGMPIYIFVRNKSGIPWKCLGYSTEGVVLQQRTAKIGNNSAVSERLKIELLITHQPEWIPAHDPFFHVNNKKVDTYKHDALAHLGVRHYISGDATPHGKFASRNLNVGMFGW